MRLVEGGCLAGADDGVLASSSQLQAATRPRKGMIPPLFSTKPSIAYSFACQRTPGVIRRRNVSSSTPTSESRISQEAGEGIVARYASARSRHQTRRRATRDRARVWVFELAETQSACGIITDESIRGRLDG